MLERSVYEVSFYDPFNDFSFSTKKVEVRVDPLTGDRCRILDVNFSLPEMDVDAMVSGTEKGCPFCPENIERVTPRFPEDITPDGRLKLGGLFCFPNIVSYSLYSSVVTVTPYHFKMHENVESEHLVNAFKLSFLYLKRIAELDARVRFCSVNWNFLYPAGASIAHPHLQTMADPFPSTKMKKMLERAFDYYLSYGKNLFEAYLSRERDLEERYLAEDGGVHLLVSFSPLGALPDYTFVFKGCRHIFDVEERVSHFVSLLKRLFRYFSGNNIYSFNLALYLNLDELPFFTPVARVTPRLFPRPVKNSDVNFVKMMQDEGWVLKSPESVKEMFISA